jgi:hypothetical protein
MNMRYPSKNGNLKTYFAQSVKDRVEVHQDLSFGYLGDIVQALGGEVPHPILHVCEAIEKRIHKLIHVRRNSYTKGDGRPSQTDQPSIPSVEVVGGVAEHLDELIHNLADTFMVPLLIAFPCKPEKWQLST